MFETKEFEITHEMYERAVLDNDYIITNCHVFATLAISGYEKLAIVNLVEKVTDKFGDKALLQATDMVGYKTIDYIKSELDNYCLTFNEDFNAMQFIIEARAEKRLNGDKCRISVYFRLCGAHGIGGLVFSKKGLDDDIDSIKQMLNRMKRNNKIILEYEAKQKMKDGEK